MDIICFSHLRWNFVYQRPQHLLSRFAKQYRVFFIEEPIFDADKAHLDTTLSDENVWIVVPHLPPGLPHEEVIDQQQKILNKFFDYFSTNRYICWYYTPMGLEISDSLINPELVVYDCMDELSAFKNAPPALKQREEELMKKADLVFTGGHSLFEAKKHLHRAIYPFPSSIDKKHFNKARHIKEDPADQRNIPHPRVGFFGVVDERFDIDLLDNMARQRPDLHFVIIGPVVKIDPATLPVHPNIHYLGGKQYAELPAYMAGWDVAMIPFAANESTRFISPTKTPEYLAGGLPVVSTSIRDVINPYGEKGLVYIADKPEEYLAGIAWCMNIRTDKSWQDKTTEHLADLSWDNTYEKMLSLINNQLESKSVQYKPEKKENEYV